MKYNMMEQKDTVQTVLIVTEGHTPVTACISIKRPLCRCLPWPTRTHRVASFTFQGEARTSLASTVDVERLRRLSESQPEALARVKVRLQGQRRGVVASLALDYLLGGLTRGGPVQLGRLLLRLLPGVEEPLTTTTTQAPGETQGQDREETPVQGEALLDTGLDLHSTPLGDAPCQAQASQDAVTSLVEAPRQGEAPQGEEQVPSTPGDEEVRRSLQVAGRFMDRLTGPEDCFLEYLQRRHGVSIYRARRKLHVKGRRDAVLACHEDLQVLLQRWRKQEDTALSGEPC